LTAEAGVRQRRIALPLLELSSPYPYKRNGAQQLEVPHEQANAMELLLLDIMNEYNTKPRTLHRANLVDDCLTALFHFRTVEQQNNSQ
jgi:hypothetical protein